MNDRAPICSGPATDAASRVAHLIKALANAEAGGDPRADVLRERLATARLQLAELEKTT